MFFWKAYIWLLLLLTTIGNLSIFFNYPPGAIHQAKNINAWIESFLSFLAFIPLFLFAYRKRFFKPLFWKIFFCFYIFFEIKEIIVSSQEGNSILKIIVGTSLTMPAYIIMFIYAFTPYLIVTPNLGKQSIKIQNKTEDWTCVYVTHNEYEAELIKGKLESLNIKVIMQKKSDVEAPGSMIHKVELFVLKRDQEAAKKICN